MQSGAESSQDSNDAPAERLAQWARTLGRGMAGIDPLEVTEATTRVARVRLVQRIQLKATADQRSGTDRKLKRGARKHRSVGAAEQAAAERLAAARSDAGWVDRVGAFIRPWADRDTAVTVWQAPAGDFARDDCVTCGGAGQVRCHACGGRPAAKCSSCGGSGRRKCSFCNNGFIPWYSPLNPGEQAMKACHHCTGGQVTCSACGGRGGEAACSTCRGKGHLRCGACQGKGRIWKVYRWRVDGTVSHGIEPDAEAEALLGGLAGDTNWLQDNLLSLTELERELNEEGCVAQWEVEVPVSTVTVKVAGQNFRIRNRGNRLDDIQSEPFLLPVLQPMLDQVAQVAGNRKRSEGELFEAVTRLRERGCGRLALSLAADERRAESELASTLHGALPADRVKALLRDSRRILASFTRRWGWGLVNRIAGAFAVAWGVTAWFGGWHWLAAQVARVVPTEGANWAIVAAFLVLPFLILRFAGGMMVGRRLRREFDLQARRLRLPALTRFSLWCGVAVGPVVLAVRAYLLSRGG